MINVEESKCSFCFKSKSEVKVLIKGKVKDKLSFICNKCVENFKKMNNKPIDDLIA